MAKNTRIPPRDLRELLAQSAARYGTKTAIRDKKDGIYQDISYARLGQEVRALACMLSGRFAAGDRVLVMGKNSYEWVLSFLALIELGAVPVPVDPSLRAKQLAAIAVEAEAKGVLYAPHAASKRRALVGVRAVCFDKYPFLLAEGKHRMATGQEKPAVQVDPDGLAALFFTPGTTDAAKGVMLSHNNLLATLQNMDAMMRTESKDVFLSFLPLSHTYECVCGFLYPVSHGATVAFAEGLDHLLRNMREIHPTCMVTIPLIATALYRKCWERIEKRREETAVRRMIAISDPVRPLSARQALKERLLASQRAYFGGSLRRLLVLGGGMEASVQKGLRQLGVFAAQGYGMTECAGLAALNRDDFYRDGAAGLVFPDAMLDIYNTQPDGSGEIRYRGKNVMLGYVNDEERTAKALSGGWYYTGDVGVVDKEGFLHILGRRQNCIETVGGHLICPEHLERLLCQSPFIREAVVVGTYNEATRDSEAAALILPDTAYAAELFGRRCEEAALEELLGEWVAELNSELALYQQIGFYAITDRPFPRDEAGRVLRAAVAKEFEESKGENG